MAKGLGDRLETGVPDIWRGLGEGAGSIWKGVRTLFNFKGEQPQVQTGVIPAAYTTILSNQASEFPELPVEHPTLGLKGVRFQGSQYLFSLQAPVTGAGAPDQSYLVKPESFPGQIYQRPSTTGNLAAAFLGVNPWNFGSKLAFRSFEYQRFRFNGLTVRVVSTCGVNTPGTVAWGYWKDFASGLEEFANEADPSFGAVADLVPSLSSPVNVAQSSMSVRYDGPELYYTGYNQGVPYLSSSVPASWGDAQNRQEQQGALVLVMDSLSLVPLVTANVYIDYDIELYDPTPSSEVIPVSVMEKSAIRDTLRFLRSKTSKPLEPSKGFRKESLRVIRLESFLKRETPSAAAAASSDPLELFSVSEDEEKE